MSMINRSEKKYGDISVVQHSDYKWGVVDAEGNEIVPFGTYDWIDFFDQGLARVKIGKVANNIKDNGNKWGLINTKGVVVLPIEYDSIWNFAGKNRSSTKTVKDGIAQNVYLHDLNPDLPMHSMEHYDESIDDYDDYGTHYGEYAGSYAQDVMGYSDDAINDAFEGDPDNYWNID